MQDVRQKSGNKNGYSDPINYCVKYSQARNLGQWIRNTDDVITTRCSLTTHSHTANRLHSTKTTVHIPSPIGFSRPALSRTPSLSPTHRTYQTPVQIPVQPSTIQRAYASPLRLHLDHSTYVCAVRVSPVRPPDTARPMGSDAHLRRATVIATRAPSTQRVQRAPRFAGGEAASPIGAPRCLGRCRTAGISRIARTAFAGVLGTAPAVRYGKVRLSHRPGSAGLGWAAGGIDAGRWVVASEMEDARYHARWCVRRTHEVQVFTTG
jgi:hypothetical protein